MDSSSSSNYIDIFEIYRRYCDIRTGRENQSSKEMLAQLLKLIEQRGQGSSLLNDLFKLMSYLDLTVDSGRFACFYDFVYFTCRENGQKNITIEKAIEAWKLVLNGRFRLLNDWCSFVETHQRHNISEDTWQQVLAFSRCVHENLEGYDPKGAWPVLIDDFVDHMHRITKPKSSSTGNRGGNCGDSETQADRSEDGFPGLKLFSGLKRKPEGELSNNNSITEQSVNCTNKRNRAMEIGDKPVLWDEKHSGNTSDIQMDIAKHGGMLGCSRTTATTTACVVERSLSEGFAGLLSNSSRLQFDHQVKTRTASSHIDNMHFRHMNVD